MTQPPTLYLTWHELASARFEGVNRKTTIFQVVVDERILHRVTFYFTRLDTTQLVAVDTVKGRNEFYFVVPDWKHDLPAMNPDGTMNKAAQVALHRIEDMVVSPLEKLAWVIRRAQA